jgi:uncharacterized OB-fold protein
MPLINCPECEKEISDKAPTCPGCGSPIAQDREAAGSGVQTLTTTQGTSKRLKLQSLFAMIILGIGLTIMLVQIQADVEPGATGPILTVIGLTWAFITRVRIWWHHS